MSATGRVVIAVDPHKASWTAAAVDESLQALDTVRVPVSQAHGLVVRFPRSGLWAGPPPSYRVVQLRRTSRAIATALAGRMIDTEHAWPTSVQIQPSQVPGHVRAVLARLIVVRACAATSSSAEPLRPGPHLRPADAESVRDRVVVGNSDVACAAIPRPNNANASA